MCWMAYNIYISQENSISLEEDIWLFESIDTNKDQYISMKEFKSAFKDKLSNEEIEQLFY